MTVRIVASSLHYQRKQLEALLSLRAVKRYNFETGVVVRKPKENKQIMD